MALAAADPPHRATVAPTTVAVLCVLALQAGLKAVQLSRTGGSGVDFGCFHVVGALARVGRAAEAYDAVSLHAALERAGWSDGFMPWSYPPQFALLTAAWAALPLPVAYLFFVGASGTAFLWVLRRIAGERFDGALLLSAPVIAVNVAGGQNGLLTGALAGAAALGLVAGRPWAGWGLGALVIKPHLAVGIAVSVLAGRRWGAAVIAAGVVLASAAATLWLGAGVWPAFVEGARQAAVFLREGLYPLHRMTSVYAAARSSGVGAPLALLLQAVTALAAMGATARIAMRAAPRAAAGFALIAGAAVSPYLYDYDMTLLVLGVVILEPEIERSGAVRLKVLAVAATLYGLVAQAGVEALGLARPPALGGVAVAAAVIAAWRALRRVARA